MGEKKKRMSEQIPPNVGSNANASDASATKDAVKELKMKKASKNNKGCGRVAREDKCGLFTATFTCLAAVATIIGVIMIYPDSADSADLTSSEADATDRLFLIFLIPPALGIIMAVFGLVASAYAPAMIAGLAFCAPIYCVAAWAIASVFAAVGLALITVCGWTMLRFSSRNKNRVVVAPADAEKASRSSGASDDSRVFDDAHSDCSSAREYSN